MNSELSVFTGITIFYISVPFLALSIVAGWRSSRKNRELSMYMWEFFALW